MVGEREPAEISRIRSELVTAAEASEETGAWLESAMAASWSAAEALLSPSELADLVGERHKIIANNWQRATNSQLVARYLRRAVVVLEHVDFSPAALRADVAGERIAPRYLHAAAELINHAADLWAASSVLVRENEARWRVFHARVPNDHPTDPGLHRIVDGSTQEH
jgi:hypothetical protein